MTDPSTDTGPPVLAIVGHPNKGKSSIVSTLAQDASVRVSPRSGTTTSNRAYAIRLDSRELCRLVDTPGFQRPRAAMDWMQRHSGSTADHPEAVRRFLEEHRQDPRFSAECELLGPIVDGAGILYVIDGSVPYGPDYDAEMEILRWTGGPSMALINRIGAGNHVADWRRPLSQYFRIVREFNAISEPFEQQVQLLTGFSELCEEWRKPLREAADSLVARRALQMRQAGERIAKLLENMLGYSETAPLRDSGDQAGIAAGRQALESRLGEMERVARADVEQIFNHGGLDRDESALEGIDEDLFSEQTWKLFGLSRDQVLAMGAAGGAATGALVDIGTGGLTVFLGSSVGAAIGAAGAWLGSRQLVNVRVRGQSLGGHQAILGPVSSIHFPWIVLGRAVTHLRLVSRRNHAVRARLRIEHRSHGGLASELDPGLKKSLQSHFSRLSRGRTIRPAESTELGRLVVVAAESDTGTVPENR